MGDNPDAPSTAENPFAAPSTRGAATSFDPTTHEYSLADRGARLGGALLDMVGYILTTVIVTMLATAAQITVFDGMLDSSDPFAGMFLGVLAISPYLLVTGWLITTRGQSPGKILVGTKIVRVENGEPIGFVRGVLFRLFTGQILLSFVPLYGLFDALRIFGEARRCIHDYLGGSIVVNARPVRRRTRSRSRSSHA